MNLCLLEPGETGPFATADDPGDKGGDEESELATGSTILTAAADGIAGEAVAMNLLPFELAEPLSPSDLETGPLATADEPGDTGGDGESELATASTTLTDAVDGKDESLTCRATPSTGTFSNKDGGNAFF